MAGTPWFRPRRYGFGLTPASWQGWVLTIAYVIGVFVLAFTVAESQPWIFWTVFVVATVAFLLIALLTRERR